MAFNGFRMYWGSKTIVLLPKKTPQKFLSIEMTPGDSKTPIFMVRFTLFSLKNEGKLMPEFEKLQLFVVKHMLKASLLQVRIPI